MVFLAAAATTLPNEPQVDIYNSGASRHMTPYHHCLFNYTSIEPKSITAADKGKFQAIGKGDMHIYIPGKAGERTRFLVRDVLYALQLGVSLLSVSKITAAGYGMLFRGSECRIYGPKDKLLGKVPVKGGLYHVETDPPYANAVHNAPISVSLDDLHQMMGHIAPNAAKRLVKDHIVEGIILDKSKPPPKSCDSCKYGKKTRKPVKKVSKRARAKEWGELIHSDLWGPSPVRTPQHKEYYVSYTDNHTRYSAIFLVHQKSETFKTYQQYEA